MAFDDSLYENKGGHDAAGAPADSEMPRAEGELQVEGASQADEAPQPDGGAQVEDVPAEEPQSRESHAQGPHSEPEEQPEPVGWRAGTAQGAALLAAREKAQGAVDAPGEAAGAGMPDEGLAADAGEKDAVAPPAYDEVLADELEEAGQALAADAPLFGDVDAADEAVLGGAPAEPGFAEAEKSVLRRHLVLRVAAIALLVLFVAFAASITALAVSDAERVKHVPANTKIDADLDVGGQTQEELRQTISDLFTSGQSEQVDVDFAGDLRQIELQNIGEVDVDAMVAAAFEPYDVPVVDRMIEHVDEMFGAEPAERSIATTVKPTTAKVTKAIQAIADEIDVEAQDACYEFSDEENRPVVVEAEEGRAVDVDATVKAVEKAITNTAETGTVEAVVATTEPESTDAGQAIYVDTNECVLHFYVDGAEERTYACTPGKSGYTTPHGDWTLSYKDPAPTWYNPHSSWSESMPETIGPGESNPLGLRALAVSCGGGIFIHGTTSTWQLGSRGSHGCVRLANASIVELYDLVDEGVPIYIR